MLFTLVIYPHSNGDIFLRSYPEGPGKMTQHFKALVVPPTLPKELGLIPSTVINWVWWCKPVILASKRAGSSKPPSAI